MKIKIMLYGLLMAQSTVFCANSFDGARVNHSGADKSILQAQWLAQLAKAQEQLVKKYQKENTKYVLGIPVSWPTEEDALLNIFDKIVEQRVVEKRKEYNKSQSSIGLKEIVTPSRPQSHLPSIKIPTDEPIYYDSQSCNDDVPGGFLEKPIYYNSQSCNDDVPGEFLEKPIYGINDSGTNDLAYSTNFADAEKRICRLPVTLAADFLLPKAASIRMNYQQKKAYESWLEDRNGQLKNKKSIEAWEKKQKITEKTERMQTAIYEKKQRNEKHKKEKSDYSDKTETIDNEIEKEKDLFLREENLLIERENAKKKLREEQLLIPRV